MTYLSGTEERKLIQHLKEGSVKAFDRLYALYAKQLYAYCLEYTKSTEDTEEIVQDVFISLWNKRELIKQTETLRPLLFVMAKHKLINAYRTRINQPVYEDYINYANTLGAKDQDDRLEYEDFLKSFQKALSSLPVTQQEVIRLSRLEQLSNKVIAQQLSLSEQTVKNQLSLGLKRLKELLADKHLYLLMLLFAN